MDTIAKVRNNVVTKGLSGLVSNAIDGQDFSQSLAETLFHLHPHSSGTCAPIERGLSWTGVFLYACFIKWDIRNRIKFTHART